jgi:hypothetical protein
MSVEYFDERREMVAAIRVIALQLAAEVGKTAPDDRVAWTGPRASGTLIGKRKRRTSALQQ